MGFGVSYFVYFLYRSGRTAGKVEGGNAWSFGCVRNIPGLL